MGMELCWNDIERGNPNNLEKNLSQSHFVHCKFNMDWPGIRPVSKAMEWS